MRMDSFSLALTLKESLVLLYFPLRWRKLGCIWYARKHDVLNPQMIERLTKLMALCNYDWESNECEECSEEVRGCLVFFFLNFSFNFHYSSFITHHLKYPNSLYGYTHLFGTLFLASHHSIFSTFCGPIPEHHVISSLSLPVSLSLFSFHFLPLKSPLSYYSPNANPNPAKIEDGADLPPSQPTVTKAWFFIDPLSFIGEICIDFLWVLFYLKS